MTVKLEELWKAGITTVVSHVFRMDFYNQIELIAKNVVSTFAQPSFSQRTYFFLNI